MDYNDAIIDGEFTAFCKEDKANGRLSIKMSPKKGRKSSFRPRISGVFLFPKTRTPADLSPSAVLPSPSDRRSAFFRHLPAPFLLATCLHLPPTFLLLVLPFCRLLGGFLYIPCLL